MDDITCPIPRVPSYADVQGAIKQARKNMPDLPGVSGHRREAARQLGVDYKTFMDVLTKRTSADVVVSPSMVPVKAIRLPEPKVVGPPPATVPKPTTTGALSDELQNQLNRITTQFTDKDLQADVRKALAASAEQVPTTAAKLNWVEQMTNASQARFGGKHTLAGYVDDNATLMFHKGIRGKQAEALQRRDVATNWLSKCDHKHGSVDTTVAHEFGHHISATIRNLGPKARRELWDDVADGLDLPRPNFVDERGLAKWGERHRDEIAAKASRYGATHPEEMLAEMWAEYMSGAARPQALRIGDILKRAAEGKPRPIVPKVQTVQATTKAKMTTPEAPSSGMSRFAVTDDVIESAVEAVNPNAIRVGERVVHKTYGSAVNCQKTSYATELRVRGRNVVAQDGMGSQSGISGLRSQWKPQAGETGSRTFTGTQMDDLAKRVRNDPVGSRYIVEAEWTAGGRHIFNAVKRRDGSLRFFDGQKKRADATEKYLQEAKSLSGFRVDNMEPKVKSRTIYKES